MAQSVERRTFGFGSGHDLAVREFEPHIGLCTDSVELAWDSLLPLSLCPYPTCARAPSLKINVKKNVNSSESTAVMEDSGYLVATTRLTDPCLWDVTAFAPKVPFKWGITGAFKRVKT